MGNRQVKRTVAAIAAVAIMVLIFFFSAQPAKDSDSLSREVGRTLLEWFPSLENKMTLSKLDHCLRKLAHFTIYFVLGVCLTVVTGRQKKLPPITVPVLIGTAFAVSDEIHQIFSDGRGPMIRDVVLDACGVAAGSVLAMVCERVALKIQKGGWACPRKQKTIRPGDRLDMLFKTEKRDADGERD